MARLLGRVVDAPVERHPVHGLLTAAWARRHRLRPADALYVELAVARGSALVTTDRRLRTVPMVDVVVAQATPSESCVRTYRRRPSR